MGVAFGEWTGKELARLLSSSCPEEMVEATTLDVPVAVEVGRAVGLDQCVVLQKAPQGPPG